MKLYHINADDWDGSPHGNDLFVRAENPEQAVRYWQEYYNVLDDDNEEGKIPEPDSVDEVPDEPAEGPIGWDTVPVVWVSKGLQK